jgi:hypothetical protein
VSTTGTPPLDPDAALVNVELRVKGAFRSGTWHVTDRFGEIDVETRRPDRLLVATATDASGPPAGPAAPRLGESVRLPEGADPVGLRARARGHRRRCGCAGTCVGGICR